MEDPQDTRTCRRVQSPAPLLTGSVELRCSSVISGHTFDTKERVLTTEPCISNLDETFSEETDDWSRSKGEGEIYSKHDGGEDDEASAEVVLHHCHILRLHQPSPSPTLKSTHSALLLNLSFPVYECCSKPSTFLPAGIRCVLCVCAQTAVFVFV